MGQSLRKNINVLLALILPPCAGPILFLHAGFLVMSNNYFFFEVSLTSTLTAFALTLSLAGTMSLLLRSRRLVAFSHLLVFCLTFFAVSSWIVRVRMGRFLAPDDLTSVKYLFERYSIEVALKPEILALLSISLLLALALTRAMSGESRRRSASWASPLCALILVVWLLSDRFGHAELRRMTPEAAWISYLSVDKSPGGNWYASELLDPLAQVSALPKGQKVNIIIILVEALRRDVIGLRDSDGELVMPTLSRLADLGYAYPQAYAQSSDTTMSLYSIISGRYPLQARGRPAAPPPHHILSVLGRYGWTTGFFSVFEWSWVQEILKNVDYASDPTLDGGALQLEADLTLERHGNRPHSQEVVFLLDELNVDRFEEWFRSTEQRKAALIALYGTHFPYNHHVAETASTYFFPRSQREAMWEAYLNACKQADGYISRLLKTIEASPTPSIIAILGDHGEEFYEDGGFLHAAKLSRTVMNTAFLLMGLPDTCIKPASVKAPVGQIDVTPTILSALGLEIESRAQGLNLCTPLPPRRPVFASSRAFRNQDALILDGHKFLVDLDGYPAEVYSLETDPLEQNNLATDRALQQRAHCLLREYQTAQRKYHTQEHWPGSTPPQYADAYLEYVSRACP